MLTKIAQAMACFEGICDLPSRKQMQLSAETNFDQLRDTSRAVGRGALTPIFDPDLSDISEADAVWIRGLDANAEVCHIQAARFVGTGSLRQHILANRALYMSRGLGISPEKSEVVFRQNLSGRLVYHGELWLRPDFRAKGLGSELLVSMMKFCQSRWHFDYFFGLSLPHTTNAAFARKMGYSDIEPIGVRWRDVEGEPVRDEGLVWLAKSASASDNLGGRSAA
jgi:GNAT superfamily N-acetyltransferase